VTASTSFEGLAAAGEKDATGGVTAAASLKAAAVPTFAELYEASFDFVWRSARRLGVLEPHADDVVQEVFMVVHRRLADFEGRSSCKTWLFGITRRVVATYHRSARRRPTEPLGEREPIAQHGDPEQRCSALEGQALLHAVLDALDLEKREVFVLAELEQMSGPDIARALDLNLNTMHARLRAARREFEQELARRTAAGRSP